MRLVDDWKKAWRWLSVQGLAILAAAPIVYENFALLQDYLSPAAFHNTMGVLAVLAIIGRVIKQ